MPFIKRGEVRLYYEVHGQGTPLLLSHGFSSTSSMWRGQIDAFSQRFKLIIWDMRGHGKSDYPEDPNAYSESQTVEDMACLLDHVDGKGKAIVGGLSLGGYMSLAFYRVYPDRVTALLIVDTGPGFKKDAARDAWNQTAEKTAMRFETDGLAPLQSSSPERSMVTHRNSKGLALAARGMLTQRNAAVINSLSNVRVPSLVVVGADDTPFLAASEYMVAKIPNAKKVVIPSAGHASNIDQPQAFNKALVSFLEGLQRPNARL